MTGKTKEELEQEIQDVLDQDDDYLENYENLSTQYCAQCGARLTVGEFEDFESECENCTWEDTSGLIDDVPESELEEY